MPYQKSDSQNDVRKDKPTQPEQARPTPKPLPQWRHKEKTGVHRFADGTVSKAGDVVRCHKSALHPGEDKFERYTEDE